mmetsp:Transcript_5015/g.6532  ORF Transcript_5015/g.6532 Transcript_5015/m.6532 type:complete len:408 (+) Transcript_5015:198-1421(+)|eukprot:CAMPEP_0204873178 /NCGR_PEP_ID=MMETSP1348-20121228/39943_1 /ASSEMBLY_ACC=CAM_ASM_000700 /TAXON_ID=215587 /ORGANISM="Aplanochytrium stocchinoi, Strain GSBS06" /LENGTH=407 /DNA_ID=CAMNT_0052028371 /DNA_START=99 /DNA_END=1322 /DNA_ORIENTATION=+
MKKTGRRGAKSRLSKRVRSKRDEVAKLSHYTEKRQSLSAENTGALPRSTIRPKMPSNNDKDYQTSTVRFRFNFSHEDNLRELNRMETFALEESLKNAEDSWPTSTVRTRFERSHEDNIVDLVTTEKTVPSVFEELRNFSDEEADSGSRSLNPSTEKDEEKFGHSTKIEDDDVGELELTDCDYSETESEVSETDTDEEFETSELIDSVILYIDKQIRYVSELSNTNRILLFTCAYLAFVILTRIIEPYWSLGYIFYSASLVLCILYLQNRSYWNQARNRKKKISDKELQRQHKTFLRKQVDMEYVYTGTKPTKKEKKKALVKDRKQRSIALDRHLNYLNEKYDVGATKASTIKGTGANRQQPLPAQYSALRNYDGQSTSNGHSSLRLMSCSNHDEACTLNHHEKTNNL